MPAIRNAGGRDKSVIVNPNSLLADKYWTVFKDIGAGFHSCKLCSQHTNEKPVAFPHKHLYLHATCQFWTLGSQLTRYHMMADLVGDCYWFPPAHQHVLVGETIALQARSSLFIYSKFTFIISLITRSSIILFRVHTFSIGQCWVLRPSTIAN